MSFFRDKRPDFIQLGLDFYRILVCALDFRIPLIILRFEIQQIFFQGLKRAYQMTKKQTATIILCVPRCCF